MVKINEINRTATFAWSHDAIPVLATGTAAGVIDDDFSSSSTLSFHSLYDREPLLTVDAESKFNDLDWSKSNEILAGALENGTVQLWNTANLQSKKTVEAVATGVKHTGTVKALQFNPNDTQYLLSGGSNSEMYIWDTNKLTNMAPFAPGTANTQLETVTALAWNPSVKQIFAAAGSSGFATIWDLNSKREVLQLQYKHNGTACSMSSVAWHPTTGTTLMTASEADGAPIILTWDLRNSNAPSSILEGHKKGVLSLDWNSTDPSLLLSCGKDNTTILWNPLTSEKLAQYPTTSNWSFKTKFAPGAPDIFATSSFDKKVIVQSMQDTSPPVNKELGNKSGNDFWNEIASTETQHPQYFVKQAPSWYGRKTSVAFAFGGKIVTVSKTGDKSSSVQIKKAPLPGSAVNEKLVSALDSGDFKPIIETRLESSYDGLNKADWEMLNSLDGTSDVFEKFLSLKLSDEAPPTQDGEKTGEAFFTDLNEHPIYAPSGEFKFTEESKDLTQALLQKKLNKAVEIALNEDKLTEALVIALNGPQELKDKVSNYYFNKFAAKDPVARLLYSTGSGDVSDVVDHVDVSNWKEIATAIKTYSTPVVAKAHFIKLGDRVLAADPVKNREDSIVTYINASALDKVAEIWNSELKTLEEKIMQTEKTSIYDAHFASLSEFVEKFSAYRSTLNLDAPIAENSSTLSTILEYINIISTNGQFELASKFLALLPSDVPAVKLEQERISKATGVSKTSASAAMTTSRRAPAAASGSARYGNLAPGYGASPAAASGAGYPGMPPIPQPQQTQVPRAPVSNPYLPNAGAAPTAPSYGYQPQHPSQSPYAQKTPLYGQPASATPVNPYMPAAPAAPVTQAAVPPPPKTRKHETEGWNDLPSHFHQQPSRRSTPAAPVVPAATNGSSTPTQPVPLSRTTSFAAAPSMPPPPRSVSKSRKTPTLPEAKPAPAPQPNNRYAPSSPQPNFSGLNGVPGNNFAAPPPQPNGVASAPPRNPYAPTAGSTPASNPYAPAQIPGAAPAMGSPYGMPPPQAAPVAMAPPVNNPYAPTQTQQPPVGNAYAAPPPQQFAPGRYGAPPSFPSAGPPPQMPPKSVAPPPKGPASAPPIHPQQPPAAPAKEVYPSGDRSHIPPENKKIFEVIDASFKNVAPKVPEQFSKQVIDTEKRLNFLYDHLNNQDLLTAPSLQLLDQLADALSSKNFGGAMSLHLQIMANHSDETGNWGVGVKRLIQFCEATES